MCFCIDYTPISNNESQHYLPLVSVATLRSISYDAKYHSTVASEKYFLEKIANPFTPNTLKIILKKLMHLAKYREHSSFFRLYRYIGWLFACRRPYTLAALTAFTAFTALTALTPLTSFVSLVSFRFVAQQQWQGVGGDAPIFSNASVYRRRLHERVVSCLQCSVYLAVNCCLRI